MGEENFQIKHIKIRTTEATDEHTHHDADADKNYSNMNYGVLVTPPGGGRDSGRLIQPLNQRFTRKVLYHHDRTQRKLASYSNEANRVFSMSSEAVDGVKKTVNDWNEAQDNFE